MLRKEKNLLHMLWEWIDKAFYLILIPELAGKNKYVPVQVKKTWTDNGFAAISVKLEVLANY